MDLSLDRWTSAANRRRVLLFGLAFLQTTLAGYYFLKVIPEHGATGLEKVLLVLFVILFAWISLGFWTAVAGFFSLLANRNRFNVRRVLEQADLTKPLPKTAIVVPICNEDVARVFAGLRATYHSLAQTGKLDAFEFFILSDTNDPDTWVAEEKAWADWCEETGDAERIHYRLRKTRIKRKTGNIADFCRRWGANYRYMIVFDADSVMSGEAMVSMVRMMETRHEIGILQTAPLSINRSSLYARVQQFGNHVYGQLFAAGLNFWQMGDGYYWGHNAIIRLAPFIEHCALKRLPGAAPMGGEILSHDFVEAAYIRRAGWEVWLAYDLPGSYEEPPPTLLDELKRDRRWSQGNLQHLRLISGWGIRPTHRIMFLYGMMAYGSSLLWLFLLGLSTVEVATRAEEEVSYFPDHYTLFPTWPEAWHAEWVIGLAVATATLLFLPKFLGIIHVAFRQREAGRYGGVFRLTISVMLEAILSSLLAPVRMLFHSRYVLATLLGRESGWGTQQREDAQTHWGDAFYQHGPGMLLALAWGAFVYLIDPAYLLWILPIIVPLLIAVPVSVFTSLRSAGIAARNAGLFLIPAETDPCPLIEDLNRLEAISEKSAPVDFEQAIVDPVTHALHLSLLPEKRELPGKTVSMLKDLREKVLAQGPKALSSQERLSLLRDPESVTWLHHRIWESTEEQILRHWSLPS